MEMFVQQLINGLSVGFIYGLVALGYTMVYGVLKLINFAHGELFMLGPMFVLVVLRVVGVVQGAFAYSTVPLTPLQLGLVLFLSFVAAGLFSGFVGILVERVAYRRLRRAPPLSNLVSALAASLFLSNATMLIAGRNIKPFPRILPTRYFTIAGATLSNMQLFIVLASLSLLALLLLFVQKTPLGRAIRAVSEDKDVAGMMGVDVNRTIAWVFLLGPGIGAISGVLFSMYYGQAYYSMGMLVGNKAFIAAVMGGIGNIVGSVVGGVILGVFEVIGAGYLPIITGGRLGAEYQNTFAFVLLILVLIIRPQGIFGERVSDR